MNCWNLISILGKLVFLHYVKVDSGCLNKIHGFYILVVTLGLYIIYIRESEMHLCHQVGLGLVNSLCSNCCPTLHDVALGCTVIFHIPCYCLWEQSWCTYPCLFYFYLPFSAIFYLHVFFFISFLFSRWV